MLSVYQQKVLIKLFFKKILKSKDFKDIYKHKVAFYRAIKYLMNSQLVYKENGSEEYKLTLNGDILSRILLTLTDVPEHLRQYSRVLRTTDEVDLDW